MNGHPIVSFDTQKEAEMLVQLLRNSPTFEGYRSADIYATFDVVKDSMSFLAIFRKDIYWVYVYTSQDYDPALVAQWIQVQLASIQN